MNKLRRATRTPNTTTPVEFIIEIDASALDRDSKTMRTTVEGKWLSKPFKDALIAPLLSSLNDSAPKKQANLKMSDVTSVLVGEEACSLDVPVHELASEDGTPVIVSLALGGSTGGAVFNVTLQGHGGYTHPALPAEDAAFSTMLTAKWLKRPLRQALIKPLVMSLNDDHSKGNRLSLANVVSATVDGYPVKLTDQAIRFTHADGTPVQVAVQIGPAAGGGMDLGDDADTDSAALVTGSNGLETPTPKFSKRKMLANAVNHSSTALMGKVMTHRGGATFHIIAGSLGLQAYLPKGAMRKSLREALLEPFLAKLDKPKGGRRVSEEQRVALRNARVEVDGEDADTARPAQEFVRDKDVPVVVTYILSVEHESALPADGVDELSISRSNSDASGPATPGVTHEAEEGEHAVFGTINSGALARARAARKTGSSLASLRASESLGSPSLIESNGDRI